MDPETITILYGSQTGNAEDLSKRVAHRVRSLGFRVEVEAMDDFPLRMLPKRRIVIFVCSTTGHGQEPENMKYFYNFIRRRDLPKRCLRNLNFAVYGLGDSSYAKFNYVSKILFKRLKWCGAQPIQELTLGDEQHRLGCDGIIYPKLDDLWSKLGATDAQRLTLDVHNLGSLPESSYTTEMCEEKDPIIANVDNDIFKKVYSEINFIKSADCIVNDRLTPASHFQDTRLICLKGVEPIKYEPGDVCTILPANSDENVQEFLTTLNLDGEQRFSLCKKDPNFMINYLYDFIPNGLKVRDLVKYYLDIQSVPRRSFFEFLWPFSDDKLEREKLQEFASTEGQEEMCDYCIQPKRSILEVLLDFPHTVKNIKFDYIFDLVPPIKPRSFSIASASVAHPNELHLIVGVVKYQTRLRKTRRGLCSNYLSQLRPIGSTGDAMPRRESRVRFSIRRSSFKLPEDHRPIIMIGPGLGIAPFRSFIQARASVNSTNSFLYFGCRFRNADFYFKEELDNYVDDKLLRLRVAFSRENPKKYVQDLLLEDSAFIKNIFECRGAIIYVAGNSKLPEQLRALLIKILKRDPNDPDDPDEFDAAEESEFITRLEEKNRIQYDCW